MISVIQENSSSIQAACFLGLIGCMIGILVYDEHPDLKTFLMRVITSLILAPIAFMASGIWFTDDMSKIAITIVSGFIGRPFLRGVHRVFMLISEKPLETVEKIVSIWRKK